MTNTDNPPLILRLGGSIVSHSNKVIDFDYLRELRDLLREQILIGKRFIIIVGGGQTYREFRDLAMQKGNIQNERDLHWMGIAINTLHAEIVRAFLTDEIAEDYVWKYQDADSLEKMQFSKPVAVVGAFKPGFSSDNVALIVAKAHSAKRVFDLKNIDGVYSADPKQEPNAKHFANLTWDKYFELVGNKTEHKPGDHLPVDVVAAREAKAEGMEFVVLKATDLPNLENAINGEAFKGTTIK